MLIVDDLLGLPFRGLAGVFRKVYEMADRELNDENYLQQKLLEIQLLFEMDEITEADYVKREAEIRERLNTARGAVEEGTEEDHGENPGSQ
ncbi:MAG: gas vesicle protein GvpG [Elusimicrobia bacterium]|nr:gas vesicle protein GvpG [Elusimicrobiota bacterium]